MTKKPFDWIIPSFYWWIFRLLWLKSSGFVMKNVSYAVSNTEVAWWQDTVKYSHDWLALLGKCITLTDI